MMTSVTTLAIIASLAVGTTLGMKAKKPVRGIFAGAALGMGIWIASKDPYSYGKAFATAIVASIVAGLIASAALFYDIQSSVDSPMSVAALETKRWEIYFTVFEAFAYSFTENVLGDGIANIATMQKIQGLSGVLQLIADNCR
jgi:FtsH-binding integral membrane protein